MELLDKRERILAAAEHLFSAYGVRHSTMEQIAKHAQVGKGTLYLYFTDKDALFGAVMERKWQDMERLAKERLTVDRPIIEQLIVVLQTVTETREKEPFFQKIQLEHRHYLTPEIERGLQMVQHEAVQFIEELVQRGIRDKELPYVPSRMLAFLLVKSFSSFSYEWPESFGPLDMGAFIDMYKTLLQPE
jgi:AcrR family transcriptional regulator